MSSSSARPSEAEVLGAATAAPRTPGHYRVTVEPSGDSFVVHPGENLLAAGRRAGVWLPFECGWGSCGTCKATLVSGEVELLFPDAPAIDPRDERRRRILTCQTTTATDVTLKVNRLGPFNERPTTDHMGTLVTRRELAPGIDSFTFKLPDRADFRPGQYAILGLGPDLRRCYSMDGFAGDEITFVAKHYPGRAGSSALHALELGAQVPISLPFGDMWVRDDDSDAVLIAGGTGVAPILAVLREMHRQGRTHRVTVLYGANTPAELVCLDELAAAVGELPDAELIPVVQAADAEWSGRRGLATTPLKKIVGPEHRCYLAGPPPMVDAVITVLKDRGVRMDHVHYDRFG